MIKKRCIVCYLMSILFTYSALPLLFFWLGNYVVPDMIFKNTVFRKREVDDSQESSASPIKDLNSLTKVL